MRALACGFGQPESFVDLSLGQARTSYDPSYKKGSPKVRAPSDWETRMLPGMNYPVSFNFNKARDMSRDVVPSIRPRAPRAWTIFASGSEVYETCLLGALGQRTCFSFAVLFEVRLAGSSAGAGFAEGGARSWVTVEVLIVWIQSWRYLTTSPAVT